MDQTANQLIAVALALAIMGCGARPATPNAPAAAHRPTGPYRVTAIALPGAGPDGISLDYLAFDPATGLVWLPAGPTGSVDVVDTATRRLTQIAGFPTREFERDGRKRVAGPSSVAIGRGVVYIGSRADASVCAMDARPPGRRACATVDSPVDGLAYVAPTDELWVTTPRDKSIRILDGKTLAQKARLAFDGDPEGYAVDAARGRFYTNLEDKDVTLAIDLASHDTIATWHPGCGDDGPRGLRLAEPDGLLFVACSAKTETLDVGHGGAVIGAIDTGEGADDLDYAPATRTLYIAGGRAGTLTIAAVDARGGLTLVETVATKRGARNAAVDAHGTIYVADGPSSELLVVAPAEH